MPNDNLTVRQIVPKPRPTGRQLFCEQVAEGASCRRRVVLQQETKSRDELSQRLSESWALKRSCPPLYRKKILSEDIIISPAS